MKADSACKLTSDLPGWTGDQVAAALGFASAIELSARLGAIKNHGYDTHVLAADGKRRVISAPRKWLKALQRRALDEVLSKIPVSNASFSRPGAGGVVASAKRHLHNAHMTVIDVRDCFPSTTLAAIRAALQRSGLPPEVATLLARITTHHGALPQGPPTSPAVLDCVFMSIDGALASAAAHHSTTYTRYMDDLAFSGPQPLGGLIRDARHILREADYEVNERKLRSWGPGESHTLTGIVLTTTLNPTAEFLRALTAELQRLPRGQCRLSRAQLAGRIGWVCALNPALGHKLQAELSRSWPRRQSA